MGICYEATNANPNSIYIPIKICLERYNQYDLPAYIDSGCFVYFGNDDYFQNLCGKSQKFSTSKNR